VLGDVDLIAVVKRAALKIFKELRNPIQQLIEGFVGKPQGVCSAREGSDLNQQMPRLHREQRALFRQQPERRRQECADRVSQDVLIQWLEF
jgi:hypothetical protein